MELTVSGRLTSGTGEQPSFLGCRIESLFEQKCVTDSNVPSTLSDAAGNFTLMLPDWREIAGKTAKFVVWIPRFGHRDDKVAWGWPWHVIIWLLVQRFLNE
jgi:hypothetical protein